MSHKHHKDNKKHDPATFKQVEIDETVKGHFDLVVPLCNDYHQGKFTHVKLQHVYAEKNGHHDWFYWAQVKTG